MSVARNGIEKGGKGGRDSLYSDLSRCQVVFVLGAVTVIVELAIVLVTVSVRVTVAVDGGSVMVCVTVSVIV
jgi:hypothetical protein